MLSREQQREILAVGFLALALFVLLALTPIGILGPRGEEWFPSGNFMGTVGGALHAVLFYLLGLGSLLIPILLGLSGMRSGDWLSPQWTLRLAILAGGLLLLIPPALHSVPTSRSSTSPPSRASRARPDMNWASSAAPMEGRCVVRR